MDITVGSTVNTRAVGAVAVERLLGEGMAGRVFAVSAANGDQHALKWFRPDSAVEEQWQAIQYLLDRGAPDPRFLWPDELVGSPSDPQFGYLMPLRPDRFLRMTHLASGRDEHGAQLDVPFVVVVELCRQLAEAFLRLHAEGMCYRDISLANVFFDPTNGDILVCDLDNVAVDDGTSRVRGTGRFMAPEIVADRDGVVLPSTWTDRHSLAVLLFVALFCEHPLEGQKSDGGLRDDEHLARHFGDDPVFSMDPADDRNRPVPSHVSRYWNDVYPVALRRIFTRAFTEGLKDRRARISESQWVRTFTRLRDVMGTCPACSATVFFDVETVGQRCWSCSASLGSPLVLVHDKRRVVVGPHLRLTTTTTSRPAVGRQDRDLVLGRATAHPRDKNRIGLVNVSASTWHAAYSDGEEETVATGEAIELLEGLVIAVDGLQFDVVRQAPPAT